VAVGAAGGLGAVAGRFFSRLGLLFLGLGSGLGFAALVGALSLFFGLGAAATGLFRHLFALALDKGYRLADGDILALFGD
jgi:hypothetical protein